MAPTNSKNNNLLPLWGNEKTMNLNNLILTNIQSSHYFKVNLFELKTYHEVIDEIYYKVNHLEPWEKGSRKTSGQTGMCGGVRGVGAGGIVSTAFCLLYKLFTLKLTRKQLNGLITHCDSPYIRALGFMYIRYTQPPADLWDWYESYLDDEEELDVKAGSGCVQTIGEMLRHYLTKLEWYSTLFPRIPVPIQKDLEKKLAGKPLRKLGPAAAAAAAAAKKETNVTAAAASGPPSREKHIADEEASWGEAERISRLRRSASRDRKVRRSDDREDKNGESREERDRTREKRHERREHDVSKENGRDSKDRSRKDKDVRSRSRDRRHRSRSKERRRSLSRSRDRHSNKADHHHQRRSRTRSRERHREK